jgi:prophage regulatory protein
MKVLAFKDLREKGIPFTRQYIHKLVKRREFPQPIKLSSKTNGWIETEINAYIEERLSQRTEVKTAATG